jgi:hypothetical protein
MVSSANFRWSVATDSVLDEEVFGMVSRKVAIVPSACRRRA